MFMTTYKMSRSREWRSMIIHFLMGSLCLVVVGVITYFAIEHFTYQNILRANADLLSSA